MGVRNFLKVSLSKIVHYFAKICTVLKKGFDNVSLKTRTVI
jgi:hypothetical protein